MDIWVSLFVRYCTEGKRTFGSRLLLDKHVRLHHRTTDGQVSPQLISFIIFTKIIQLTKQQTHSNEKENSSTLREYNKKKKTQDNSNIEKKKT